MYVCGNQAPRTLNRQAAFLLGRRGVNGFLRHEAACRCCFRGSDYRIAGCKKSVMAQVHDSPDWILRSPHRPLFPYIQPRPAGNLSVLDRNAADRAHPGNTPPVEKISATSDGESLIHGFRKLITNDYPVRIKADAFSDVIFL